MSQSVPHELPPLRIAERKSKLLAAIKKDGMVTTYQQSVALDSIDRDLLVLLAGFSNLPGAQELSKILQKNGSVAWKPAKYKIR